MSTLTARIAAISPFDAQRAGTIALGLSNHDPEHGFGWRGASATFATAEAAHEFVSSLPASDQARVYIHPAAPHTQRVTVTTGAGAATAAPAAALTRFVIAALVAGLTPLAVITPAHLRAGWVTYPEVGGIAAVHLDAL